MSDDDWDDGYAQSLGMFLNGASLSEVDEMGRPVTDDSFLLLLNASDQRLDWVLPKPWARDWKVVLCTVDPDRAGEAADGRVAVTPRSTIVLSDGETAIRV